MKCVAAILLFFYISEASSQPSDVLVLKRKAKTVQSFYAGSQIQFTTIYGAYKDAVITRIHNDTVFLQEFQVRQIPTTLGTVITDTTGSFRYACPVSDIYAMGRKSEKNFNVSGSGAALFGGGILLVAASGVVYIADREKFSPALAGGAAALAAAGYLLSRSAGTPIIINKRGYTLEYIDTTP